MAVIGGGGVLLIENEKRNSTRIENEIGQLREMDIDASQCLEKASPEHLFPNWCSEKRVFERVKEEIAHESSVRKSFQGESKIRRTLLWWQAPTILHQSMSASLCRIADGSDGDAHFSFIDFFGRHSNCTMAHVLVDMKKHLMNV